MTENWRIREVPNMFFIEADLKDAESNGHYPRVEVMQEDYGDHNGYTDEIRRADAELIVSAPEMKEALIDLLWLVDKGAGSDELVERINATRDIITIKNHSK